MVLGALKCSANEALAFILASDGERNDSWWNKPKIFKQLWFRRTAMFS